MWAGASAFVAIAAVFGLLYSNLDSVRFEDIVRPLLVVVPISGFGAILLMAIYRPLVRIFPVILYLFFTFYVLKEAAVQAPYPSIIFYILIFIFILILYFLFLRIEESKLALYNFVVAAAVAAAVVITVVPGLFYDTPPKIDEYFERESLAAISNTTPISPDLPDIIYIVPDRYPSRATLTAEYGYDNSPFYRELRKRGFTVAEDAWANYPKTFQSMASTLNSGYLERFTQTYGEGSSDQRPVFHALESNVVQERLRRLGYRFLNYGNWWEPTRINKWAEENYQGYAPDSLYNLSEFELGLLRQTPMIELIRFFTDAEDKRECRRIRRKFHRLSEIGNEPIPVFVFAHILVPHEPITMDAAGRCLERPLAYPHPKGLTWQAFKAAYIEYLKYFNTTVLDIIDTQLKLRSISGRRLVFIIQADEGPFPKMMRETDPQHNFSQFSERELRMKMGIINALRLPDGGIQEIENLLTPANNWRIIFNSIFGSGMKLLPDRIFIYPNDKNLYQFCDITDPLTKPETPYKPCTKGERRAGAVVGHPSPGGYAASSPHSHSGGVAPVDAKADTTATD